MRKALPHRGAITGGHMPDWKPHGEIAGAVLSGAGESK